MGPGVAKFSAPCEGGYEPLFVVMGTDLVLRHTPGTAGKPGTWARSPWRLSECTLSVGSTRSLHQIGAAPHSVSARSTAFVTASALAARATRDTLASRPAAEPPATMTDVSACACVSRIRASTSPAE